MQRIRGGGDGMQGASVVVVAQRIMLNQGVIMTTMELAQNMLMEQPEFVIDDSKSKCVVFVTLRDGTVLAMAPDGRAIIGVWFAAGSNAGPAEIQGAGAAVKAHVAAREGR